MFLHIQFVSLYNIFCWYGHGRLQLSYT